MFIRHEDTPGKVWQHFYFPFKLYPESMTGDIFWRPGYHLQRLCTLESENDPFSVRTKLERLCAELNQFNGDYEALVEVVGFGSCDKLDIMYIGPDVAQNTRLCTIVSNAFCLEVKSTST